MAEPMRMSASIANRRQVGARARIIDLTRVNFSAWATKENTQTIDHVALRMLELRVVALCPRFPRVWSTWVAHFTGDAISDTFPKYQIAA